LVALFLPLSNTRASQLQISRQVIDAPGGDIGLAVLKGLPDGRIGALLHQLIMGAQSVVFQPEHQGVGIR
jgi:hypothetical protein